VSCRGRNRMQIDTCKFRQHCGYWLRPPLRPDVAFANGHRVGFDRRMMKPVDIGVVATSVRLEYPRCSREPSEGAIL